MAEFLQIKGTTAVFQKELAAGESVVVETRYNRGFSVSISAAGLVEYAIAPEQEPAAGDASWHQWPYGPTTGAAADGRVLPAKYIRVTAASPLTVEIMQ